MNHHPERLARGLAVTLFALLAAMAGPAVALSSDAQQPIEIEADFAELDELKGVTIYKGNVEVRQGSLFMRGDTLRAEFDDDQQLDTVHMEGRPAYFRQRPDGSEVDVEGEALTIDYFKKQDLIKLIRKAKVTKGGQLFQGDTIDYDTAKSIIKARAKEPAAKPDGSKGEGSGRVRIVIPPQKKAP